MTSDRLIPCRELRPGAKVRLADHGVVRIEAADNLVCLDESGRCGAYVETTLALVDAEGERYRAVMDGNELARLTDCEAEADRD